MLLPIVVRHLFGFIVVGLEVVQLRTNGALAHKDIALDPPRQDLRELVIHVSARRDGKDVVQFLERALLSLRQPEEDHDAGNDVEGGVEAKRALDGHGEDHAWEGQRED